MGPMEEAVAQGVAMCPFLRNIEKPTSFAFSPIRFPRFPSPQLKGTRGPIFEDGPSFESAFKLFHGQEGVIPLAERAQGKMESAGPEAGTSRVHPSVANAASISLSSFGPSGPFGFDAFFGKKMHKKEPSPERDDLHSSSKMSNHEALGSEWLATGNCPIARSYRAATGLLPLVAKVLQPPKGMKYRCPPAIVAARAALARTQPVKALRPQPLPAKVMAVGALGIALNIPLGVWREHTDKFSPSWFVAVHASVPFIAMLRKAVVMPKYAMAFTIGASVVGQILGSRAERLRLRHEQEARERTATTAVELQGSLTSVEEHVFIQSPRCNKHHAWDANVAIRVPAAKAC